MSVRSRLDREFSQQPGLTATDDSILLQKSIRAAESYASTECTLSVLSDLRERKSYIFNGDFAKTLYINNPGSEQVIDSIWEQEILDAIHPDDVETKMLNELLFFHHIQKTPIAMRFKKSLWQQVRMKMLNGEYASVLHRLYYIPGCDDSSVRFALCLYGPQICPMPDSAVVVNNMDGSLVRFEKSAGKDILSRQEISVLQMVANGKSSKDIAQRLNISVHTVSRHRQNINAKLQVHNSLEACKIARALGIMT